MKNLSLILLFILTLGITACKRDNNKDSTENKQIVIEEIAAPTPDPIGAWNIGNYVDKFGDPTDEKYISLEAEGTFSNTATTNSRLHVRLLNDRNNTRFIFCEYGSHVVKDNDTYWVYFKLPNDSTEMLAMHGHDDGYITAAIGGDEDEAKLRQILSSDTIVSVYAETGGYGKSYYKFKLNLKGYNFAKTKIE